HKLTSSAALAPRCGKINLGGDFINLGGDFWGFLDLFRSIRGYSSETAPSACAHPRDLKYAQQATSRAVFPVHTAQILRSGRGSHSPRRRWHPPCWVVRHWPIGR